MYNFECSLHLGKTKTLNTKQGAINRTRIKAVFMSKYLKKSIGCNGATIMFKYRLTASIFLIIAELHLVWSVTRRRQENARLEDQYTTISTGGR